MIDSVELVKLLKERKHSGQELADVFKVSRSGVWKKVKKLQEKGYVIEVDKEGYRIVSSPDKVLPEEVIPFLNTKFIGRNYIHFEEIHSTNEYIKSKEFPDGAIVVAETQTAGKGRKGRKWVSIYSKGLYFSVLLKPRVEVYYTSKLSLLFLYSVFKVLKTYVNEGLKIKWPNDIYLNGKKLAGFLIDSSIENNEVIKIVLGVGINVSNDLEDLMDVEIATSLKIETGKEFNRKTLLANLLQEIEIDYYRFLETKFFDVINIERDLLWLGENVKIYEDGKVIHEGTIEGLNDDGALKLRTKENVELIYIGELSVRGQL
ncbi:MAG: biotin--[acetyl-CoA-carboxylase] ligase [Hydrogenothermaceae bacterium]|nr:biotin--[acetyl-CoA-carboxylase] ligase [Hydrogenothermaceae bacterium]